MKLLGIALMFVAFASLRMQPRYPRSIQDRREALWHCCLVRCW